MPLVSSNSSQALIVSYRRLEYERLQAEASFTKSTCKNELLQVQTERPRALKLEGVTPAEDVEAVITNHLVLFESIDGLLRYREKLEKEQDEAIREPHGATRDAVIQACVKERDALKSMLARVRNRTNDPTFAPYYHRTGQVECSGSDSGIENLKATLHKLQDARLGDVVEWLDNEDEIFKHAPPLSRSEIQVTSIMFYVH
ncbi:Protein mlp1 [Stygiomarasmius scandens]|uniref:Protein mlp1 n=1 Tax=Marasmiellus scandens TaxID=2682957 RepID=A0ABR1ITI9_9AGAR